MVQLHVVEELLELLRLDHEAPATQEPDSDEDQLMCISKVATTGQTTPCTIRLVGKIATPEILILVDSDSSHSFISEEVATQLRNRIQPMQPVSVKIADGDTLSYSGFVPACKWTTQGCEFVTDLRVLSLRCYDM